MLDLPKGSRVVALDTETSGLHPDPPERGRVAVVIVAWWDDAGQPEVQVLPFDQGILDKQIPGRKSQLFDGIDDAGNLGRAEWDRLCLWLQDQHIVMHNAYFDLMMMAAGRRGWADSGVDLSEQLIWDTMLVAPLLWPLQRIGLKEIAERLWGEQERVAEQRMLLWLKHSRIRPVRYDLAPWDIMEPYARQDGDMTLRVHRAEHELVAAGEVTEELVQREVELCRTLFRMSQRGIGFDLARCAAAAAKMKAARAKAAKLVPFQPITEARARAWWFGDERIGGLGLIPNSDQMTKLGKASVNKSVVADLIERGAPGAAEYQAWNQLDYALEMWYEGWPPMVGDDGRLRTVFRQAKTPDDPSSGRGKQRGTVSGRLAVERVQLQAIPHDYRLPTGVDTMRSMFRAREGHQLWELDLAQAEMRVAAGIAKCVGLMEAINNGEDVHDVTCKLVFGIDPDHPDWFARRQVAKRLGLGMLYGAGVRTTQEQIHIHAGLQVSIDQVKVWVHDYRERLPELARAGRRAQAAAERRGYVRLCNGRQRWFKPDEETHKAFNAVIQGGVAVAAGDWMIEVEREWPGVLLLQIHDSLVIEPPIGVAGKIVDDVAALGAARFERYFGVPFEVEAKLWQ